MAETAGERETETGRRQRWGEKREEEKELEWRYGEGRQMVGETVGGGEANEGRKQMG